MDPNQLSQRSCPSWVGKAKMLASWLLVPQQLGPQSSPQQGRRDTGFDRPIPLSLFFT